MKHILLITQRFYPESFRINDIAVEWVRRGYRVTVLTGIPNYPGGRFFEGYGLRKKRREVWRGVEILRVPVIPRGRGGLLGMLLDCFSFAVSGLLWNLTSRVKADLVFSHETSPMTQVLIGCAYRRKHRVPHLLYAQDLWPENVEMVTGVHSPLVIGPIDRMVDYIYKNTDHIFVTSPSFVEAVTGRRNPVPEEKVHYWPQYAEEFYRPLDRETVRREAAADSPVRLIPEDGSFKIAFTGNIGYAQGLEVLPRAAALLRGAFSGQGEEGAPKETQGLKYSEPSGEGAGGTAPGGREAAAPVRFVIIGDGRGREALDQAIRDSGTQASFLFVPRQPAERIPELLACCDAAFLSFKDIPLFGRTIPAKLQTYMACAMPIIAAAGGETERILREADCGLCAPTGDAEALAAAIRRMAGMPAPERRAMGRRGLAYCGAQFGKKALMDEMDGWIAEM